jgi:hypothetical protein
MTNKIVSTKLYTPFYAHRHVQQKRSYFNEQALHNRVAADAINVADDQLPTPGRLVVGSCGLLVGDNYV